MSYKQQVILDYVQSHRYIGRLAFVIRFWAAFAFTVMLLLFTQPIAAVIGNLGISLAFGYGLSNWGVAAVAGDVLVFVLVLVVYVIPTLYS